MHTLVWERMKKKKHLLAALLHYSSTFLSCTCQRGRQATDPDRRLQESALVSVGLAAQMAADGSQHKQERALQGEEKRTLLRFSFVEASNQWSGCWSLAVGTLSDIILRWNTVPWKYLRLFDRNHKRYIVFLMQDHIFQKKTKQTLTQGQIFSFPFIHSWFF